MNWVRDNKWKEGSSGIFVSLVFVCCLYYFTLYLLTVYLPWLSLSKNFSYETYADYLIGNSCQWNETRVNGNEMYLNFDSKKKSRTPTRKWHWFHYEIELNHLQFSGYKQLSIDWTFWKKFWLEFSLSSLSTSTISKWIMISHHDDKDHYAYNYKREGPLWKDDVNIN